MKFKCLYSEHMQATTFVVAIYLLSGEKLTILTADAAIVLVILLPTKCCLPGLYTAPPRALPAVTTIFRYSRRTFDAQMPRSEQKYEALRHY